MSRYAENSNPDTEIDVSSLMLVLWQKKGWVILWTLLGLLLAAVFLVVVSPVFKADARLLIEKRETVFTRPNDEQNVVTSQDFDILTVASQVEVLQSGSILGAVAKKLKLSENPEFNSLLGGGNPISNFLSLIGVGSDNASNTREGRVLATLSDKLSVYSVGDSRVVSVEVTSEDPVLAAEIANGITQEYLLTQRIDGGARAKDASQFLEKEIDSLRAKVSKAEQQVEDFRSSAGLIATDDESTLTKQQLSETLTLMSEVSAQRAEAEAKSDQIRRLIRSGAALDSSSDVQGSPLIQRLREQQVALRARIVDLQTSLLPNHPQVQAARSQLNDLEKEIANQALLIARALEGDAEIAKIRQQELEQEVARLKVATGRSNEQEIKLRALERDARSQRELLETYLNRFRESTARQNSELLPVNARVISQASVPIKTHFPKTVPTLAVAGFVGGFLASLFILLGELMSGRAMQPAGDRAYSDQERVAADLSGASHENHDIDSGQINEADGPLAAPLSERAARQSDNSKPAKGEASGDPALTEAEALSDESEVEVLKARLASLEKEAVAAAGHSISGQMAGQIAGQDNSPEDTKAYSAGKAGKGQETDLYTLKDALSAIDRYQLGQITVLPVFQDFSCADMALQMARSISNSGKSVIFVDVSNARFGDEEPLAGVSDVIHGYVSLDEAVFADPLSSVDLMTSGTLDIGFDDWHMGRVEDILDAVSQDYDVMVLDSGEGTAVPYLDNLVTRSDMLLFGVGVPISRRQVADLLTQKMGDVPSHSMFVYFDDEDAANAA